MSEADILKQKVNDAYSVVGDISESEFKLAAFEIVLKSLLQGVTPELSNSTTSKEHTSSNDENDQQNSGWQIMIAKRFELDESDVASLFHLDEEGSLRLILDTKLIPKNSSALVTKQIAALISAARQAAKFDTGSTSFEIIRKECEEYGCLNKKNFTSYLNQMKPKFIIEGKGRDQSIRVTLPGFGEAALIAKKYLGNEKT